MNARDPHLRFRLLSDLLDDQPVPLQAEDHLQRCTCCQDRLASLRAQARALCLLGRASGVAPARGSILGAARDAGWGYMARLLHELFVACARCDPRLAPRVARLQRARPVPEVADDLASLTRRLAGLGLSVDLQGLPTHAPDPARAVTGVRRILALLRRIEPDTPRQRLEHALLAARLGRQTEAEAAILSVF